MQVFQKRTHIHARPERVFTFHEAPDALERLTPPWENVTVVSKTPGLEVGARVVIDTRVGPFTQRLVAVHTKFERGRMFQDRLEGGPFARWEHTHTMESDGAGGCWLEDRVEYALPLGAVGQLGGGWFVRKKLSRMFEFRHALTRRVCEGEP
ncbi:MAG: SRPBCC family protein [Deltaproteobacteria bacterium]